MRRALEVFKEVCDLEGDARAEALARLCGGDAALEEQVRALLARDAAPSALDGAALGAVARQLGERLAADDLDGPDDDEPTEVGDYRIVRRIGAGGMGVVYEAEQRHPRRRVALKTTHRWLRSARDLERFQEEVQALGSLLHPAIPQVYGAITADGVPWLVMELVDGERVDRAVAGWPAERVIDLLATLADGVAHANERGIVHGDIQPRNVLVTRDGGVKLLDFGLARSVGSQERAGGTEGFWSPGQQALPAEPPDARTDVYALGRLGRVLLTRPDADLDAILALATRDRRDERYASAAAFAEDLRRMGASLPVRARRWTLRYRAERFVARRRSLLLTAAAPLLLVGLIAGGGALLRLAGERAREAEAERARQALQERLDEADPADRERLFEAFVAREDYVGTAAMARAWLDRGDALADGGDPEGALDHLAGAFVHAPTPALEEEALVAIGRVAVSQDDGDRVQRVTRALGERAPPDLVRASALWRRDLRAAVSGAATDPLLEALAPATPLGMLLPGNGARVLADRDGAVVLDDTHTLWRVGRDLVAQRVGELPRATVPILVHGPWLFALGDRQVVVGESGGKFSIWDVAHPERALPLDHPRPLTAVAFDGDVLVGTGVPRSLLRIGPDGAVDHPDPEVDAANSDVTSLAACDLDGDGQDELVGAVGPWRAFSVRVWEADGRRLRARAESQIGYVAALYCFRGADGRQRIGLLKSDEAESATVFGEASPQGVEAGLWIAGLKGDELVLERRIDVPGGWASLSRWSPPVVGDFDGDGIDDAALALHFPTRLWLLRQDAGGGFATISIPDVVPHGRASLDDDAADELIVSDDDDAYALGVGTGSLPSRDVPGEDDPVGVPARSAWENAERLARIGLPDRAAAQLAALADLATGDEAAALHLRAGALSARPDAGFPERSRAAGWLAAAAEQATSPHLRDRGHRAAAEAWLGVAEPDRALAHLEAVESSGDPWVTEQLAAIRAAGPRIPVDDWEILAPESLRPEGGLRTWSSQGAVLRREVDYEGGPFEVSIEALATRLETGAGVVVQLRPADGGDPLVDLEVGAYGGSTMARSRLRCGSDEALGDRIAVEDTGFSARVSLSNGADGGLCRFGDDGRRGGIRVPDMAPGRYELTVRGSQLWDVDTEQLAEGVVRVSVRGLALAPPADDALAALLVRDPRAAIAPLEAEGRWAWALVAALDAGDVPAARRAVEALAADPGGEGVIRRLLRTEHRVLLPIVAEAAPDRLALWYGGAWAMQARFVDTRATQDALDEPLLATVTSGDRAWRELQWWRADLAGRRGRTATKEAVLESLTSGDGFHSRAAHRELALLALAAGDEAAARRELDAWAAASPTPGLDRVELRRQHPDLAALLP